jgi:hypothetical protein
MKLTKEQIITALRNEPLSAGRFIRADGKPLSSCAVCAVGAVMRDVLNRNITDEDDFNDICYIVTKDRFIDDDVSQLLAEENYLGALSNYFEKITDDENDRFLKKEVTPEIRQDVINFVENNFPNEFEVDMKEGVI